MQTSSDIVRAYCWAEEVSHLDKAESDSGSDSGSDPDPVACVSSLSEENSDGAFYYSSEPESAS